MDTKGIYCRVYSYVVMSLAANVAASSQGEAPDASLMLEEVLVTTQFREESAQTLPIASSILSDETINNLDINNNTAVAQVTPSLSHAEFAAGQSYLALRGILSIDDGPGMDGSVVLFLDGVYIGRLSNIDFDLLDIARIEVLRGPQGTLFGRNAIGGAINIITHNADAEPRHELAATIGNYDTIRYSAIANGALSDTLNGRLSLSHREHSGYTQNIVLHEENQTEDKTNTRAQLLYETDVQWWRFSFDYSKDDSADMGRFPVVESVLGSRQQWLDLGGGEGKATSPISGFSKRHAQGVSANGNSRINDNHSVNTILAWRKSDSDWRMASTGAPFPNSNDEDFFGIDVGDLILEDVEQLSFESRWLAEYSDVLHVTYGVFALKEASHRREHYQLVLNPRQGDERVVGDEITQQHNVTQSMAIYSQAQWRFHKKWNLTGGLRWTHDKKRTRSLSINCGIDAPLVAASGLCEASMGGSINIMTSVFDVEGKASWYDLSPKLSVQYFHNDHVMAYTSIARGYKSGGFPGSPGSESVATTPVEPEEAWNYEIGLKSDLFNRKLRLNANLFYTDYKDLQIVRFGPSPENPNFGSFTTTNIGEAKIKGLELESQWLVTSQLNVSASGSYLDSKIDDLLIETTSGVVDASGSELRQAPKNKYHIMADYHFYTSSAGGQFQFIVDHVYIDSQLSDYVNRDTRIDSLSQTNAQVKWQLAKLPVTAALWVKNIEGDRGVAHSYTVAGGVFGVWRPPKTYGLTIKWEL